MKVLIINDTTDWYHFGCTGTSLALKSEIEKLDIKLEKLTKKDEEIKRKTNYFNYITTFLVVFLMFFMIYSVFFSNKESAKNQIEHKKSCIGESCFRID